MTLIFIVYCGIDVSQFSYHFNQISTPVHIISLGRLVEKKGFQYLIDACKILKSKNINFKCTIAGDGPLENYLKNKIEEQNLGNFIDITGKALLQEEITSFLHSGHIFAQPCIWSTDNDIDGIPRTLMEAMACGLPSISTKIAGIPDVIIDEETGLLVEPTNSLALAEAILKITYNPKLAEKLSRNGRNHIEKTFKLPNCLNPLIEKLKKLS